jgi:hypothetical protein
MGKKNKEHKAKKAAKEEIKKQTQRVYDLFDNPMTRAAMASMTPEQIERYKIIGEEMYGNIDFAKSEVLNNAPPFLSESLAYLTEGIKSGLHISELNADEHKVLCECYGEEWYTHFGYVKEDLQHIVTLTPTLRYTPKENKVIIPKE